MRSSNTPGLLRPFGSMETLECRFLLSAARLAIIGDYGMAGQPEADVAALVKNWNAQAPLDAIVTTGDNTYDGTGDNYDLNVGQYYHEFIYNYHGAYGPGSDTLRFIPALGNHEYEYPNAQKFLDYFTLPGNERYYDVVIGPVHIFVVNSNPQEPDGISSTSDQTQWLQQRLAASTVPWQMVVFHHPPYTSGGGGGTAYMEWPLWQWGADLVLSGHEHVYERLNVGGLPYFVNGIGGANIHVFGPTSPYSQVRYNADYGAQLLQADDNSLTVSFVNRAGVVIDTYTQTINSSQTATFRQGVNGYTGTVDTTIRANAPTTNYGASTTLVIDGADPAGFADQALLRFDNLFAGPNQIPVGSTITSATLQLNITDTGNAINLHRMLRSWTSASTWSSLTNGIQTDGIEASSTFITVNAGATGKVSVDVTADLIAWLANPASNFGWAMLPTGTNGVKLSSAEGTIAPTLTVTYDYLRPQVSVVATDAASGEPANRGVFTIRRTGGTTNPLTVAYTISGTASPGSDYQSLSGTATILAGQSSADILITPLDDSVFEVSETIILTLQPGSLYTLGPPRGAVITLTDDESSQTATFQQNQAGYAGTVDTFIQSAVPTANNASADSLVVDGDEPANTGQDVQALLRFTNIFGTTPGQIPFGSTIASATLELNINNTGHDVLLHRMLQPWADTGTWNSFVGGIQTDDFEARSVYDAYIIAATSGVVLIDVTAALRDWLADPSSNFGWAILPTGNNGMSVYSAEGANPPKLTVLYTPPAVPLAQVNITASDPNASEPGADTGRFTISRTGDATNPLTVSYTFTGSASAEIDYSGLSGSVTIPAGQSSVDLILSPIDDARVEGNETVIVSLVASPGYSLGSATTATVLIVDNDTSQTATFRQGVNGYIGTVDTTLRANAPTTNYGASSTLTADSADPAGFADQVLLRFDNLFGTDTGQIRLGSTIVSATLELTVTDAGNDILLYRMLQPWSSASTWNSLSNGIQTNGIEAAAVADTRAVVSQTGTAFIDVTAALRAWLANPASNFGWAILPTGTNGVKFSSAEGAAPPRLTVNYASPTLPMVTIAASDPNAAEPGSDTGVFTFTRTGPTTSPLTVTYTLGGTATAGSDYQSLSGTVTFLAGQSSVGIILTPLNDHVRESDESVTLTLVSAAEYYLGTPASATVIIADDDATPVISVIASDPSASEPGSDTASFTLTRTGSTTNSLTVAYGISGTANAGSDYTSLTGSVTFQAGQSTVDIPLSPLDDAVVEGIETVTITLLGGSAYDLAATNAATVTLADDDTWPQVSVIASDPSAAEPGSDTGTFTLTRTGSTTDPLTIIYSISGTATSGSDYIALSGTVTFLAGQASVDILLVPLDDALVESDENVTITLNDGTNYDLGSSSVATIAIVDNEATQTAVFRQGLNGYTGAVDTMIRANAPTTAYGTSGSLTVDSSDPDGFADQVLLRYDSLFGSAAGQIPLGSTITSAILQLQIFDAGNDILLYRMLQPWTNASTWNSLTNGIQTDGIEAAAVADARVGASTTGLISIDVTAALRAWLANPASNFGWAILPTGTNGVKFYSAEGTTKPELIINFAAPAPVNAGSTSLIAASSIADTTQQAELLNSTTVQPGVFSTVRIRQSAVWEQSNTDLILQADDSVLL